MKKRSTPPSMTFEGMEPLLAERAEAESLYQTQQLEEEFLKPLGSINTAAAEMEMNSPLFFGTIHPTLF